MSGRRLLWSDRLGRVQGSVSGLRDVLEALAAETADRDALVLLERAAALLEETEGVLGEVSV